jgi:small subunit ribosomal protein S24e
MKIEIVHQKRNELLKRTEITLRLNHTGSGTPSRTEVRKKIADMLGVEIERVYVKKIGTKTGSMTSIGEVNIYDSADQARYIEPKYIILRNTPKSESGGETA